ncbi:MAG: flagellar hook capping FlgD N-terminal domain-containing protein [Pseudomonadota bacterium]
MMTPLSNVSTGTSTTLSTQPEPASDPTQLGQEDFLLLMTTQLLNQDPFEPMDNAEFLGQMAQFSTVSGIDDMNASLASLVDGIGRSQISEASAMLGRFVLVPGTLARPDDGGAIRGAAYLTEASDAVTVTYTDPVTSEVLHVQELGAQPQGRIDLTWEDVPPEIAADRGEVRITVDAAGAAGTGSDGTADTGTSTGIETFVFARVEGVSLGGPGGGELIFTVEDYGLLSELEVVSVR